MLGISIPKKLETSTVNESKPPNKASKKVKRIHAIIPKHKDKQNNKKNKRIR